MRLCKTKTMSCPESLFPRSSWFECIVTFRANGQIFEKRKGRKRGRGQDPSANLWRHEIKQGDGQEELVSIFLSEILTEN